MTKKKKDPLAQQFIDLLLDNSDEGVSEQTSSEAKADLRPPEGFQNLDKSSPGNMVFEIDSSKGSQPSLKLMGEKTQLLNLVAQKRAADDERKQAELEKKKAEERKKAAGGRADPSADTETFRYQKQGGEPGAKEAKSAPEKSEQDPGKKAKSAEGAPFEKSPGPKPMGRPGAHTTVMPARPHERPESGTKTQNLFQDKGADDGTQKLKSGDAGDKTMKLGSDKKRESGSAKGGGGRGVVDRKTSTQIRYGVGQLGDKKVASSGGVLTSAEAALKQSESLRIAQGRITDLEAEVERLRRENEKLASAGDTLRRRSDELLAKTEVLEAQNREAEKIFTEEKKVFKGNLAAKEREITDLKQKLEELEHRLESNFKKIRVRERELEHRLEIVKMESATLVSTKDKMILELKRQLDQLTHENDVSKGKSQEMYNQFREKQETIRRVVRALRIALTILEGDEDSGASPLKKVD